MEAIFLHGPGPQTSSRGPSLKGFELVIRAQKVVTGLLHKKQRRRGLEKAGKSCAGQATRSSGREMSA